MDAYVCFTALVAAERSLSRMPIDQSMKENLFRSNGVKKMEGTPTIASICYMLETAIFLDEHGLAFRA